MKTPIVCQLCNFSPETGGTFVDAIVSLAKYSHDRMQLATFCIFPETAKDRRWLQIFDEEGIRYGFVPRRRNVVSEIRQLLRGYDPLIFHSHFSLYDLSPVFLKLMFYKTSKLLWHYHNPTPSTLPQKTKDAVKFQLIGLPLGALCIAVGDGVHSSLIEAGVSPKRLFLVHNGVNTGRFVRSRELRKRARESLGVAESENTTIFLLLGWDPLRKGVDIFVKAALEVVRSGFQNSLFLVVGEAKTREFVSKLPECSQLGQFLKVIGPRDDFPSLLNAIDVLVSSSRSEGFGYAVAEALAAEKLAICSDIPGFRELYGGVDGLWMFPTEDWRSLAELMKKAEELPIDERNDLGERNRAYVVEHYSLERWVEKIGEIYGRLLQA